MKNTSKKEFSVKSAAIIDDMVKSGMTKEARALLAIAAAVETGSIEAMQQPSKSSSSGGSTTKLASALVARVKSKM